MRVLHATANISPGGRNGSGNQQDLASNDSALSAISGAWRSARPHPHPWLPALRTKPNTLANSHAAPGPGVTRLQG